MPEHAPVPSPYKGLIFSGVIENKSNDLPISDVTTTDGNQFLTSEFGRYQLVISAPDGSTTFNFKSCNVASFLSTGLPGLRPGISGTIIFFGTKPGGNQATETLAFIAQGATEQSVEVGGFVLYGGTQMVYKQFTTLNGLNMLNISVMDTPISIPLGIPVFANGIALDNATYEVIRAV